jgi:hypothetical protein
VGSDVSVREVELRHLHRPREAVLHRLDASALPLDEVVGDDLLVIPAPHVDQQTVRQRHGGLTLVRSAPADRQTVIEAAQEARDSLPATNASSPAAETRLNQRFLIEIMHVCTGFACNRAEEPAAGWGHGRLTNCATMQWCR